MQGRLLSKLNQLERLHQEKIQAEEKRKRENTGELFKPLPTCDRWSEFAPLTWIKTSGTIKPFKPFKIRQELVQSICDNQYTIVLKSRQVGASGDGVLLFVVQSADRTGLFRLCVQ